MPVKQATTPEHFLRHWRVSGMPGEDPHAMEVGYDEGWVREDGEPSRVQLRFPDGSRERFTPHELFPPNEEDMVRYRRELKAMGQLTVQGHLVTPEIEQAVLERMQASEFKAAQLADIVEETAPTSWIQEQPGFADRVADRLIQRERKAGRIVFTGVGNAWRWKQTE